MSTLMGGTMPSKKLYVGVFSTVFVTPFCLSIAFDDLRSRVLFSLFGLGEAPRSSGGVEALADTAFDTTSGIGGVGMGGGVGA